MKREMFGGALALVASTVGLGATMDVPAYAHDAERAHLVFRIGSAQITESSSLAVSTVDPGLVYTTNDSGDDGTVYTLDASTGAVVGRTTLAGHDLLDVEAIAAASDGSLVVADIGDNDADHSTADLYRIDQPRRGDATVTPDRVDLTYIGGPRDAESVLYDVRTGRAFVVSKLIAGARVYATPPKVFDRDRARLRPVASAPALATDATFLPGGDFVVVRTYVDATVYAYPSWDEVTTFDLPAQPQGESMTAPPRGGEVWIGSEGSRSRVLAVPLPSLALSSSGPSEAGPTGDAKSNASPSTDGESRSDDETSAKDVVGMVFVVSAAGLLVILAGLVVVAVVRSRRR